METQEATKVKWRPQMTKELEQAFQHPCLLVTQFSKLSMPDLETLRKELSLLKTRYLVAKNSLSRLALQRLKLKQLLELVNGQTGFVIGEKDPIAISKVLVKFAKDHETFVLRGGLLEGEFMTEEGIRCLAALPSQEDLIGKTIFLIQSPLTRLQGIFTGVLRKLLGTLQELSKKQEGSELTPQNPDTPSGSGA